MKKLLIAMFALLLVVTPSVLAQSSFTDASVNLFQVGLGDSIFGMEGFGGMPISVMSGATLPVSVWFELDTDTSDVVIEAEISYGHGKKTEVSTAPLDVVTDTLYNKKLELKLRDDADLTAPGESLTLSVTMKDGSGRTLAVQDFELLVQRNNDNLEIQEVLGSSTAEAGKATKLTVVVKNTGADEQEDVYVRVTSPELGIDVKERAGDIESMDDDADEDVATVDVPLRIPKEAVEGKYTLNIKVYNKNVETSATKTLWVSGAKKAADSTEVVPVVKSLDVSQGATGVYQLNLLNLGNSAQTYTLSVEGLDGWATAQVNPLSLKLNPQASQTVGVGLTVSENALVGEHSVTVKVLSDGKEVRSVTLTANVKEQGVKVNTMLISVVVLAVVLVVLLVLLVKLRKSDEEMTASEESYY